MFATYRKGISPSIFPTTYLSFWFSNAHILRAECGLSSWCPVAARPTVTYASHSVPNVIVPLAVSLFLYSFLLSVCLSLVYCHACALRIHTSIIFNQIAILARRSTRSTVRYGTVRYDWAYFVWLVCSLQGAGMLACLAAKSTCLPVVCRWNCVQRVTYY